MHLELLVALIAGHVVAHRLGSGQGGALAIIWAGLATALASGLALGSTSFWILAAAAGLGLFRLAVEAGAAILGRGGLRGELVAQGLKLAAPIAVAWAAWRFSLVYDPDLWRWAAPNALDAVFRAQVVAAGALACVFGGGRLIGLALEPFATRVGDHHAKGLPEAGAWIGYLERALTFMLALVGETGAIGFVIAAKSVLRFADVKEPDSRILAEYVIIGTFMSFGWAALTGVLTLAAVDLLSASPIP